MLNVCAFVIFFSTFVGVLGRVLESLGAPRAVRALLFSAFEISSGASEASGVEPRLFGILLCAFALGFSGLSVHLQVASILSGRGVSLGRYFLSKTAEGILNAMLTYAYLSLFPSALLFESQSVGAIDSTSGKAQLCAVGFFVALFILLAKRKKELLQKAKAL